MGAEDWATAADEIVAMARLNNKTPRILLSPKIYVVGDASDGGCQSVFVAVERGMVSSRSLNLHLLKVSRTAG
jgi:hypothetical protein